MSMSVSGPLVRPLSPSVWLSILLAVLCFCSAIAVVWFTHRSRLTNVEIARHQTAINELDIRWNQLQIEQSTLASHARIESLAVDRLGMRMPGLEGSVMIARQGEAQGVVPGAAGAAGSEE